MPTLLSFSNCSPRMNREDFEQVAALIQPKVPADVCQTHPEFIETNSNGGWECTEEDCSCICEICQQNKY